MRSPWYRDAVVLTAITGWLLSFVGGAIVAFGNIHGTIFGSAVFLAGVVNGAASLILSEMRARS